MLAVLRWAAFCMILAADDKSCFLPQDPPLPGTPLEGGSKKKERSSKTSTSSGGSSPGDAEHTSRNGFDQIPTDPAGWGLLLLCCSAH